MTSDGDAGHHASEASGFHDTQPFREGDGKAAIERVSSPGGIDDRARIKGIYIFGEGLRLDQGSLCSARENHVAYAAGEQPIRRSFRILERYDRLAG